MNKNPGAELYIIKKLIINEKKNASLSVFIRFISCQIVNFISICSPSFKSTESSHIHALTVLRFCVGSYN